MEYQAAVITVSDHGAAGTRTDTSGPALCHLLTQAGWEVVHTAVVPDERPQIEAELLFCADERNIPLVLTTGGTGFSPRDVTPEATLAVTERRVPGIPEAMRAESLRLTPRGCLSRGEAGIRGGTLIVNLPGSQRACVENLSCVLGALRHGVEMLRGTGSANCGESGVGAAPLAGATTFYANTPDASGAPQTPPSLDEWLRAAKQQPDADQCGMYLTHCGVVRKSARARVRAGQVDAPDITEMSFSYDQALVDQAVAQTRQMPGIFYVQVWLNSGVLSVGDDMMRVLVGGDIRPHVIDALQFLVGELKTRCVSELERSH